MNSKGPFDPRKEAHLLSAFVDGELPPDEEARIRAHLEESEESRREVEQLRRLKDVGGFDTRELFRLFPKKPAKMIAYVAGVPKPVGCV